MPQHPTPNRDHERERDHGRDRRNSYSSSWQDRDERDGGRERDRERRDDGERDRGSGDRKRPYGHHDGRGREDRGSNVRQESKLLSPHFLNPRRSLISPHSRVDRGHRIPKLRHPHRLALSNYLLLAYVSMANANPLTPITKCCF